MDQLHTANKVCGGCCAISLNTVDTESSVSPITSAFNINIQTLAIKAILPTNKNAKLYKYNNKHHRLERLSQILYK